MSSISLSTDLAYTNSFSLKGNTSLKDRVHRCWDLYALKQTLPFFQKNKKITYCEPPAFSNVPGITQLYTAVCDMIDIIEKLHKAIPIQDHESIADARLRLTSSPLAFLGSITACFNLFTYLLESSNTAITLPAKIVLTMASLTTVLGVLLCLIEGIVETVGIKRQYELHCFLKTTIKPLLKENSGLEESEKYAKALKKIWDKSFSLNETDLNAICNELENSPYKIDKDHIEKKINDKITKKKSMLARRIRPWLTESLEKNIPSLLFQLNNPHSKNQAQAVEKAQALIKNIEIQNIKKTIIHAIGILALAVTIIGLLLNPLGIPFIVCFTLLSIGMTIGLTRFILHKILLDTEGWKLDFSSLIPNFLQTSSSDKLLYIKPHYQYRLS